MSVLFIAIAMPILSIALLIGFDICIDMSSEVAGAKTIPCNGGRLGEDIMG